MGSPVLNDVRLVDVIARLGDLSDDDVICAKGRPNWAPDSAASIVRVPLDTPSGQRKPIPDYFLEVFIAKEVLEGWSAMRDGRQPTLDEQCTALIYFALNDAPLLPE